MANSRKLINLSNKEMKKIRASLLSDSLFLMNLGVMDYSLYLTIEKVGNIMDRNSSPSKM